MKQVPANSIKKKKDNPGKKASAKKKQPSDMRKFVNKFYSKYGDMMSRLSHE